jgi:hypothetical protein
MSTPRIASPNLFAGLAPPWILANLDANSSAVQGALNDSSLGYTNFVGTDTGIANAYSVTLPFGTPSAYKAGMSVVFTAANSNTGSSTMTVSPLGAVSIIEAGGGALQAGDIQGGATYALVYNGTQFVLLNSGIGSAAQFTVSAGPGLGVSINQIGPLINVGTGFNAGSTTPATLALTAPGSNSYYGTIYWDSVMNTFGVVYSTPSAAPVISQALLPEAHWQTPLALVLIPTGAILILSTNITSLKNIKFGPITLNQTTSATSVTLNCFGASEVSVYNAYSGAGLTLTLTNLQVGVPVIIAQGNTTGVTHQNFITATTPGGVAYAMTAISSAAHINTVTGFNLSPSGVFTWAANSGYSGTTPSMIGPAASS